MRDSLWLGPELNQCSVLQCTRLDYFCRCCHALATVEFSFENTKTKSPVTLKGFYMYAIYLFALSPLFCGTNTCSHTIHSTQIVASYCTLSHHKHASYCFHNFSRNAARFWGWTESRGYMKRCAWTGHKSLWSTVSSQVRK